MILYKQILQRVVYFVWVTEKPSIQFLSKIHLSQMKEHTVKAFNIPDICPGLNKKRPINIVSKGHERLFGLT